MIQRRPNDSLRRLTLRPNSDNHCGSKSMTTKDRTGLRAMKAETQNDDVC